MPRAFPVASGARFRQHMGRVAAGTFPRGGRRSCVPAGTPRSPPEPAVCCVRRRRGSPASSGTVSDPPAQRGEEQVPLLGQTPRGEVPDPMRVSGRSAARGRRARPPCCLAAPPDAGRTRTGPPRPEQRPQRLAVSLYLDCHVVGRPHGHICWDHLLAADISKGLRMRGDLFIRIETPDRPGTRSACFATTPRGCRGICGVRAPSAP